MRCFFMEKNNHFYIRKVILYALFVALAYVAEFIVHIKVLFLTFDIKDAVIVIASMILGPLASVIISLVLAFIEFVTISDTGIWGLIMNFAGSAAFSFTVSFIYKFRKSFSGAILSLSSGVISATSVMLLMNMLITPIYTGSSVSQVVKMIPTLLLPFNFAKYMLNASIAAFLYKPLIFALRKIGFVKDGSPGMKFGLSTILTVLFSLLTAAIGLLILILFLKADFKFF